MDDQAALKMLELVRRAKAVGITTDEMQSYQNLPTVEERVVKVESEIEKRVNERAGLGWGGKLEAFGLRRKRIAAAYLAGASLNQLATLEGVSTVAIHNAIRKEIETVLRLRVAGERTARGRRRAPLRTPTEVSAMLGAVSDVDVKKLPVIVIAGRMVAVANSPDISESDGSAVDDPNTPDRKMPDEDDPYLRDEARSQMPQAGEG